MTNAQMWWYMDQLERKRLRLESDEDRVKHWLNRAQDEPTKRRFTRELEGIGIELAKVRRVLLHQGRVRPDMAAARGGSQIVAEGHSTV